MYFFNLYFILTSTCTRFVGLNCLISLATSLTWFSSAHWRNGNKREVLHGFHEPNLSSGNSLFPNSSLLACSALKYTNTQITFLYTSFASYFQNFQSEKDKTNKISDRKILVTIERKNKSNSKRNARLNCNKSFIWDKKNNGNEIVGIVKSYVFSQVSCSCNTHHGSWSADNTSNPLRSHITLHKLKQNQLSVRTKNTILTSKIRIQTI